MTTLDNKTRDKGAAVVELPLAVSFLMIPVAVLLMMLPQWPEAKNVAESAAQEAATLYATAPDEATGASRASAAVNRHQANYRQTLSMSPSGSWCRGCPITVVVTVDVPAMSIPFIGSTGTFTYSATATSRVEDYRSAP